MEIYAKRISALREQFKNNGIDALLIPEINKFLNEYTGNEEKRVTYISGLKASAGFALISKTKNAIFVDGRYTEQAKVQTSKELFEYANLTYVDVVEYISKNLDKNSKIGIDAGLISNSNYKILNSLLVDAGYELVLLETNLVDEIWKDRPQAVANPLIAYPLEYAGENSLEKCHKLGDFIKSKNAKHMLLTSPEGIMWLLNVRGTDIEGATFASCFGIIGDDSVIDIFINLKQVSPEIQKITPHVRYHAINTMATFISKILSDGETILAPEGNTSMIFSLWANGNKGQLVFTNDYLAELKAQKNSTEIEGMRKANIQDAVHFINLIYYVKFNALKDNADELSILDKLHEFTNKDKDFIEDSFSSIVGIDSHSAIIHYRPSKETTKSIKANSVVLMDRGGQYKYGTTDTTRTVSTGTLPENFKKYYTLVLKGHISLMTAKFPEGTKGVQLDALARQHLWQAGYDYQHGTGHGVGASGSVHEGPYGIHKLANLNIVAGLILTNEPGAYFVNKFGIRLEDNMYVNNKDENGFYSFTSLGYIPFDRESIDKTMLNNNEIEYINNYHKRSYETVHKLIKNEEVLNWFKEAVKEI